MKTTLAYSRQKESRGYQVIDPTGNVLAQFGSGPYERYMAERFQLTMEAPQVLRLADRIVAKYPELRKRALRAAMLYVDGHVHVNGAEQVFDVDSQNGGGQYEVDLNVSSCGCPDWEGALLGRKHSAPWCDGQPVCKHIMAAHLFEMLNRG
jgi:prepilin-type processing-associated H-X9-DG protein